MRTYVIAYVATAVVLCALDAVWLGTMIGFYRARMGDMLMAKPQFGIAALFYALYVVGILIFAVVPALRGGGWPQALLFGALLGFFCYGTYDMTNAATLKTWAVSLTVVDMAWGTVLTGIAAAAGTAITQGILRLV